MIAARVDLTLIANIQFTTFFDRDANSLSPRHPSTNWRTSKIIGELEALNKPRVFVNRVGDWEAAHARSAN